MRRGWREVWDGQQMGGRRHDMDARQVSEVLGTAILLSRVQNLESVERASVGRRLEKEDRAWLVAAGEKKMAADENFGDGFNLGERGSARHRREKKRAQRRRMKIWGFRQLGLVRPAPDWWAQWAGRLEQKK